jgi:hypothetical protein
MKEWLIVVPKVDVFIYGEDALFVPFVFSPFGRFPPECLSSEIIFLLFGHPDLLAYVFAVPE